MLKDSNIYLAGLKITRIPPRLCRALTDPNSRVDARVVANVDGNRNECTENQIPISCHA